MDRLWKVAWRNIGRKKGRSLLLMLGVALAAFVLFISYYLSASLSVNVERSLARLGADVIVLPAGYGTQAEDILISGQPTADYLDGELLHQIRQLRYVQRAAPQLYIRTISTVCCGTEGDFPIVAFDPADDFTITPWLVGGTSLTGYEAVIGADAGGRNFVYHQDRQEVVERIELFSNPFVVKDVLFPTGGTTDQTIFIPLETAQAIIREQAQLGIEPHHISVILVQTEQGREQEVKQQIEALAEVDAVLGQGLLQSVHSSVAPLRLLSYAIILLVLLLCLFQVIALFSTIMNERQKEIGLFTAMGVPRHRIYALFLWEASFAVWIGGGLGVLAAASLLYDNRHFLIRVFELPLVIPTLGKGGIWAMLSIVLVWVTTLLGAFFPIRSVVRQEPYETMREGEL